MPPDVVHLDLYRVFEAVARLGNVTAAAEELLLSQPAVSQKIRQLENDLGCSLFVRTSRGVHVTAEGEVLYRYAAEGLERFRTLWIPLEDRYFPAFSISDACDTILETGKTISCAP